MDHTQGRNTCLLPSSPASAPVRPSTSPTETVHPADRIPYTDRRLDNDLWRLRHAWALHLETKDRYSIYDYLRKVYRLVLAWQAASRCLARTRRALRKQKGVPASMVPEPFSAVI